MNEPDEKDPNQTPSKDFGSKGIPISQKHDNFKDFGRTHDPNKSLKRNFGQKVIIWLCEVAVVLGIYYYLSEELGGSYVQIRFLLSEPLALKQFPLYFWTSIYFVLFLSKIFKLSALLLGAIGGQLILELYNFGDITYLPSILLATLIVFHHYPPYEGGEYYNGEKIFKQVGFQIIVFAALSLILYFFASFPPYDSSNFSPTNAKQYLVLNFFVNNLFLTVPAWMTLYVIDRALIPYFPLTEEDKRALQSVSDSSAKVEKKEFGSKILEDFENGGIYVDDEGNKNENKNENAELLEDIDRAEEDLFLVPEPGELYHEFLTHHPLEDDDHTIVIMLGKVRVYLCTRCTAMIFGVLLSILYAKIIMYDFGYMIAPTTAFWLVSLLPIVPLTDWGLQALHIRKATTKSRLFTGFVLGFTIHLLMYTDDFQIEIMVITVVYFIIFGVLMKFRAKKNKEMWDQIYFDKLNEQEDDGDKYENEDEEVNENENEDEEVDRAIKKFD